MKKTKTFDGVYEVLSKNRKSPTNNVSPRDSDHELLIQFLQFHMGMNLTQQQIDIMRSVSFESITRARRKLQEGGEFLPSPEIARKRRVKSYEIQQTAPSESASGLQHRIQENIIYA